MTAESSNTRSNEQKDVVYLSMLDAVPGAFAICRVEEGALVTEFANSAIGELVGLSQEELLQTEPKDWIYADDAALFRSTFRRAAAKQEGFSAMCRTRRRADGSMARIYAEYLPRVAADDTLRYFIRYTNITEKRLQELEQDNRFNDVMQTMATGFAIISLEPNGRCPVLYINPAMCKLLGGTQEEILAIYKHDVLLGAHPEDLPHLTAQLQEDILGDNDSSSVCRIKDCKGKYIWVQIASRCVRTGGRSYLYCSFADISEFLEKEALRRDKEDLEDHLAGVARFLSCDMWTYDIETQVVHQFKKMPAFPNLSTIIEGGCDSLLEGVPVHPDDVEQYRDVFRRIHFGEEVIISEFRILENYAHLRAGWVRQIYTVKKDAFGEPMEAWGIAVDVNDEKQAREKYETQLFRRTSVDASALGYTCWNLTQNAVLLLDFKNIPPKTAAPYLGASLDRMLELAQDRLTLTITDAERIFRLVNRKSLLEAFRNERPVSCECQYIDKDGDFRWGRVEVSFLVEPASKDVLAFVHILDITDKKVAQDLIESTVRYDYEVVGRVDVLRDSVIHLVTSDKRVAGIQDKARVSDLVGKFLPYVREEDRARFISSFDARNILKELAQKDTYEFTVHAEDADGNIRVKRIRFADYDRQRGLLLYTRSDITETITQQEQQQDALAAALQAAENANAAKTEFFSRMSHDIRTPMNAIMGMTLLASQSLGDDKAVGEYLSKIHTSSRFLLALINDILDMSRIESGKLQLRSEPFDMAELLSAINEIIAVQAGSKAIHFESVFHASLDRRYIGDRMKLEQILLNVLGNAIKFTDGGGSITFDARELERTDDVATLRFIVTDTGIGISETFLEHMFEPFSQENARPAINGGTGLGMAITQRLVERMGGGIQVHSVQEEGTEFTVTLCLGVTKDRAQHPEEEAPAQAVPLAALDFTGRRVLLAEDHPLNMQVAQRLLEHEGFVVDTAENGQLAIDAFAASKEGCYDVILMDIRMPVMDGLAATKAIRALEHPDAKSIPIIAMTANAFEEDVKKSLAAGIDAHLAKPIEPDMLFQTLYKFINKK
ncbi:MAG: response regulator [Clostridia bacterium]|nr:response regulator [Clostridia bacterium]